MSLFHENERHELRARRQNEGSFAYLNTSARPGIAAIRTLLDQWFEHFPDDAKPDVLGRFRSRNEANHHGAFFELYCHELLRCIGYEVEIHPPVPNASTNPDFLAKLNGNPQFYLEATQAHPAQTDQAAQRRIDELHDTLNRMNSPDYFLGIEYRGSPEGNIRGRALRERLENWMRELDYDAIALLYQQGDHAAIPNLTWQEQDFTLTFAPIPKGPQFRGRQGARPVGIVVPTEMELLKTHEDIRAAIEGKAMKYGELSLPLVVAVNVMADFCDDFDILNALFGDEQLIAILQPDGGWEEQGRRVPNGAWYGRRGPRNSLVSAAVVVQQLRPSTLRDKDVELIHNPWAAHPLPLDAFSLPQRRVTFPDGQIHRHAGRRSAEILAVPEPWPVPDEQ